MISPLSSTLLGVNLDIVSQLLNNTVKLQTITDHSVSNKLVKGAILSSIFCEQLITSAFILIIMM